MTTPTHNDLREAIGKELWKMACEEDPDNTYWHWDEPDISTRHPARESWCKQADRILSLLPPQGVSPGSGARATIRKALESALAGVWDGHYSGTGVTVGYAQAVDAEVKAAIALLDSSGSGRPSPGEAPTEPAPISAAEARWTRERPTEADWYMVRGPGFRACVEIQEIAGLMWPRAPYSWEQFDGCEWCIVGWPVAPSGEAQP